MVKALGGFQAKVARRIMRRLPQKKTFGNWAYTSAATETAREEAGLLMIEDYIWRRQNTVAHYIAT